jgi:hypothetical protein
MAKAGKSRSFGLSAADLKALKEKRAADRKFPNPYRAGIHGFTIDALIHLGINKYHPLTKVRDQMKLLAGDDWYQKWASKESRNDQTGKDPDGRILQNLKTLQRTADYGLKLLQVGRRVMGTQGAVIDMQWSKGGEILVRLHTKSAKPMKMGRNPVLPEAQ